MGGGHILVGQVAGQRSRVHTAVEPGNARQCLELGGKSKERGRAAAENAHVVQGLLAHAVACGQQSAVPLVPQRERKHAVDALDHSVAPLLVAVHQHLAVGARTEIVAPRLQLCAQLDEVVDLAVEDNLDAAVLVAEGLVSGGGQINHGQAPVAQTHTGRIPSALAVRATRGQGAKHRRQYGLRDGSTRRIDQAGNSTHGAYNLRDSTVAR